MLQNPVTFFRQVLALCDYPQVQQPILIIPMACANHSVLLLFVADTVYKDRSVASVHVTSGCACMQLLDSDKVGDLFPSDVISRARRYLAAIPGGTGAYSDSRGAMVLRQDIAKVWDAKT